MKLKYILYFIVATLILTSCEQLGIEVTTVKGNWKSQTSNGQHLSLEISEDETFISKAIHQDSLLLRQEVGTWRLANDTLYLYTQKFHGNGVRKLRVEQLSMNILTLRNDSNGIRIFNRIYSTPNNDYDSHFEEVFDLKKGFWWYAWQIFCLVFGVIVLFGIGAAIISFVKSLTSKKTVQNK